MNTIENIFGLLLKTLFYIFIKSIDPIYLTSSKKENEMIHSINDVLFE
jgi:hypothetical protein